MENHELIGFVLCKLGSLNASFLFAFGRDSASVKFTTTMFTFPKGLAEKVAKLHLPALSAELNVTTEEQAEVTDVRL